MKTNENHCFYYVFSTYSLYVQVVFPLRKHSKSGLQFNLPLWHWKIRKSNKKEPKATPEWHHKSTKNRHKNHLSPPSAHFRAPRAPGVTKMQPKVTKMTPQGPQNEGFRIKNDPIYQSVSQWINASTNQRINDSTTQRINDSTNQWSNESMKQRINYSTNQ